MKKILLFLAVFIFLAGLGWGQDTYVHKNGGWNWDDPNNWEDESGNPVADYPGHNKTDDTVIINGTTVQISSSITLGTLEIHNYGATDPYLNINASVNVEDLILDGTLHIAGTPGIIKISNITVTVNGEVYGTIDMNGSTVQVPHYPGTLTIDPVNGNLGNIDAGDRDVTINIPSSSGNVTIGNIKTTGDITINVGGSNAVIIGDVSSGGNVTIDVGIGGSVDVSDIHVDGTISLPGAGDVNLINSLDIFQWIGATDSDWDKNSNWTNNAKPGDGGTDFSIIIHSSSYDPVFSGAALLCHTMTIQANASLDMGIYNLTVDTLENDGILYLAGVTGQNVLITTTPPAVNGTVFFNASGDNFAGLTNFKNLVIDAGTRNVSNGITVSGDFTIANASLIAASVNVTNTAGTSNLFGDVTTSGGTQTYSGNVNLSGTIKLTGTTVNLGPVGVLVAASLTIDGEGILHGGSGIGALTVTGDFTLLNAPLSAATVNVTGTSSIAADITTTGNDPAVAPAYAQFYNGTVTLGNDVIFTGVTGSTVQFDNSVNGITTARDLTITNANVVFNGAVGPATTLINNLTVNAGTASINANINTTENQTFNGAVTLSGTRVLTSTSGSITAAGIVTGAGITVNTSQGISLANASNALTGNITLNNTQTGLPPAGNITFTNISSPSALSSTNNGVAGYILINQGDDLSITSLKTNTGGSISILSTGGEVTQTGEIETDYLIVSMSAGNDILLAIPSVVNKVAKSVNLTSTSGNIYFTNGSTGKLLVTAKTINGIISINETTGELEVNGVNGIDAGSGNVSLEADGNVTQTAIINANELKVETNAEITLSGNNTVNTVSLESKAASSAQGNITYKNSIGAANKLNVTVAAPGNVTITEDTGSLDVDSITSGVNINLTANTDIETKGINVSGIINLDAGGKITVGGAIYTSDKVTLKAGGDITVSGNITAYQLTATAAGTGIVTVNTVNINSLNTGSEGINAAIYIKAADFIVTSITTNSIVPGGTGGQLCLDLNTSWTNPNIVVVGSENVRWHQHFVDLTNNHLVYGILPSNLNPLPLGYVHIQANDIKTTFTLGPGKNVFINDAVNTNISGIKFETSGSGFIKFSGTNKFKMITLKTAVGEYIYLDDTKITVTDDFVLSPGNDITLVTNIYPGTAVNSIKAKSITLNGITTTDEENLTIESTTGDITIKGTIGSSGDLGDVIVKSADKVTFSGVISAKSLDVTSTGTTIGADITTTGDQTYTGAVTLNNNINFTGNTGSTVIFNNSVNGITTARSLRITNANAVFNGTVGSLISSVDVTAGTTTVNANITTTGNQTYSRAVTLGNDVNFTSAAGSKIQFDFPVNGITTARDLTITNANVVFNGTVGSSIASLIKSVNVTAGTTTVNANITTTGAQTYTGAVTLGGDIEFKANTGSTVRFNSTVNGAGSAKDLTITDADVIFNGAVLTFIRHIKVTLGTTTINTNNITTTGAQTYTGAVTLGGTGTKTLAAGSSTVTLGLITGNGNSLTITGDGELNGGSGINILTVTGNFNLKSGSLNAATVNMNGAAMTSTIAGNITTTGAQTYSGAVIIDGLGSVSGKRTITAQSGDILFSGTLDVADQTKDRIELIATGGKITVGGTITAYQLIVKATGIVTVKDITINSLNNGNDGLNAAIYIEADDLITTSGTLIVPGDMSGSQWGQLCLVLNTHWINPDDVIDDINEDLDPDHLTPTGFRWHQHYIPLNGHLVYGSTIPTGVTLLPTDDHISAGNVKTTFILKPGFNVYISDAVNTTSGLVFKTSGIGFIKFSGTNEFENITLESGGTGYIEFSGKNEFENITLKSGNASGQGIRLVDTEIIVNEDFILNNNEITTLDSSAGSSIKAASISLNIITAVSNKNLSLSSTTGEINLTETVGTLANPIGDITVVSANNVTFSGAVYANSIGVTSINTTIGANITTTGNQTYTGAVTLDGASTLITLTTGTGTTVTLGAITGGGKSLTITGNGVLNGGTGINVLSVTGAATINQDITTTGNQTYSGAVTLGNDVNFTGAGSTIRFNSSVNGITTARDLTITNANVVFNGTVGSSTASLIRSVNVTAGTTSINADITTTGAQTYNGAVTLSGSPLTVPRIITSQSGNIDFNSTLTFTGGIINLSAANITISGSTNAGQLIAKAPSGTVKVDAITITANTGNRDENAAIYIDASTFIVTTTTPGSIIPGSKVGVQWGQLCLKLSTSWAGPYDVIDGSQDMDPDHLTPTNFRWHQHVTVSGKILYSFTEDSNGNGRLDRIRVQTNVTLNGGFSDFEVSVEGYVVTGYGFIATENDSFYINLNEIPELDSGNTPLWSIVRNTSLVNNANSIVGDPAIDINKTPIDTIPPRIAYTLTIPGNPQTYVQMSEPVVTSSGGDISASFGGGLSVQGMSQVEPAGLGYLFNLSGSFKIEDLANNIGSTTLVDGYFQMNYVVENVSPPTVIDNIQPKYPLNWGYTAYGNTNPPPPYELLTADMMEELAKGNGASVTTNTGNPVIRRVTDVLVSMAPEKTDSDNYFAWPVWARFKKSLNAPYAAGNDVFWGQQPTDTGIIWQFDGTNFLETSFIESNEGIELQARINDNLSGDPVIFWTTADIPAEYRNPKEATEDKKTGGLWLPNVPLLYNFVLLSDGINGKSADGSSSKLFNYNIPADGLVTGNVSKFEFIFRLSNVSDMFIARMDIPRGGAIPVNWYTLLRPFVFEIRNIRRQRGGVTIMNNVINSNNKEVTYIRYHLLRPGRVTVQIYTLDGTMVKSLRRNEQREMGEWTDTWDGTNNGGRAVARGMYFVRIVGPDIDEIRKIMVVK